MNYTTSFHIAIYFSVSFHSGGFSCPPDCAISETTRVQKNEIVDRRLKTGIGIHFWAQICACVTV